MNRAIVAAICLAALLSASAEPNQLTAKEKKLGWRLLFDGKTLNGWRNFKKPDAPQRGWSVQNGCLILAAHSSGGDIITTEKFMDFDLEWDWRIEPKGNNGLKYFVTEERDGAIGHEYQLIDDSTTGNPKRMTGSFYDVLAPTKLGFTKPCGQWNHSRIRVDGKRVEHWLNGKKVLSYELGSRHVRASVAQSKFKDVPGFGEKISGHILLTDHGDPASFRNIKIRELNLRNRSKA
jgi:hypothetical protein